MDRTIKTLKDEIAKMARTYIEKLESSSVTLEMSMNQCTALQVENKQLKASLQEREGDLSRKSLLVLLIHCFSVELKALTTASPKCMDPEHSR